MFLSFILALTPAVLPDGVADQLTALESAEAGKRLRAQRWLAVNLTPQDYPAVAASALGGGAETGLRLAQALGTDDRHLELAALLATDRSPMVARVGEQALVEQVLRWSSSALDPPARPRRLPDSWVEDWPRVFSMDVELGGLVGALERLDRLGTGPAPLVLDPFLDPAVRDLAPDREPSLGPIEGSWTRVLLDLTRTYQVSFEVHGHRDPGDDGESGARAFVRVCKRGMEGRYTASELLIAWIRASLVEHDPGGAAAACRALATSGWPAALHWMGKRWGRDGDLAALEGLLLSAAQGRVEPGLATRSGVRRLLERADRFPLAEGPRIARALAGVGGISVGGEGLQDVLLEGWSALEPSAQWVRLVALEGGGFPSPAAAERCSALLASQGPAWLRRQALRAHPRVGGDRPQISNPLALFEQAVDGVQAMLLARELVAAGARPAAGWGDGTGTAHLARALWALGLGEVEVARSELGRLLVGGGQVDLLAGTLRHWAALGAGESLARLGAAGPPVGAPELSWRRMVLLAGAVSGVALEATAEELLAVDPPPRGILLELGALAGGTGSLAARARQALVRALGAGAPTEFILPALEVAVLGLRRGRQDSLSEAFQAQLRATAAREGHPATGRLYAANWPPRPVDLAPRLETLDRIRH